MTMLLQRAICITALFPDRPIHHQGSPIAHQSPEIGLRDWALLTAGAQKVGDHVHLVRRQLSGRRAHLLIDVVLSRALGKVRQLPRDIRRVLPGQRRSADFMAKGAMATSARWNAALLIANED